MWIKLFFSFIENICVFICEIVGKTIKFLLMLNLNFLLWIKKILKKVMNNLLLTPFFIYPRKVIYFIIKHTYFFILLTLLSFYFFVNCLRQEKKASAWVSAPAINMKRLTDRKQDLIVTWRYKIMFKVYKYLCYPPTNPYSHRIACA